MICKNCGKQVKDEADFCPFCGNVLRANGKKVSKNKSNKKGIIIAGIVVVLILLIGAVCLTRSIHSYLAQKEKQRIEKEN